MGSMKRLDRRRLDRRQFRRWLAAHEVGTVVGASWMEFLCPLACYLSGAPPDGSTSRPYAADWDDQVSVDGEWVQDMRPGAPRRRRLPAWAARFTALVDGPTDATYGDDVTRERALRCLDAALAEGEGA